MNHRFMIDEPANDAPTNPPAFEFVVCTTLNPGTSFTDTKWFYYTGMRICWIGEASAVQWTLFLSVFVKTNVSMKVNLSVYRWTCFLPSLKTISWGQEFCVLFDVLLQRRISLCVCLLRKYRAAFQFSQFPISCECVQFVFRVWKRIDRPSLPLQVRTTRQFEASRFHSSEWFAFEDVRCEIKL